MEDRQAGAPPQLTSEVTPEMLERVLSLLERSGLIEDRAGADAWLARRLCLAVLGCARVSR